MFTTKGTDWATPAAHAMSRGMAGTILKRLTVRVSFNSLLSGGAHFKDGGNIRLKARL